MGWGEDEVIVVVSQRHLIEYFGKRIWSKIRLGWQFMGDGRGINSNLVQTVKYLLKILVRLCVNPINTIHNIDMQVSFNWGFLDNYNYDVVGNYNTLGIGRSCLLSR